MGDGEEEELGEERWEAFPADDEAPVFALEPSECAFDGIAGDGFFQGAPSGFSVFPDPFRDFRLDATTAQALTDFLVIIPFIKRGLLDSFAGAPAPASA